MAFTTLISTTQLAGHLPDEEWRVVDCRFSTAEPEKGRRDYRKAHIPGAVYAHLDEDLSGPILPGKSGRHPLPEVPALVSRLSRWGISNTSQVVVYDDTGGSIAARLWWLLKWMGHDQVAVLDGGFQAWLESNHPVDNRPPAPLHQTFVPHLQPNLVITTQEMVTNLQTREFCVIDSRASERYRGEQEPIDPVAGHIPGAKNAPHPDTLGPDGRFLPPEQLRKHFRGYLESTPSEKAIFYCGSGVTATRNLLAMMHAGLGLAKLYVGSWSEWICDPDRPIKTGDE